MIFDYINMHIFHDWSEWYDDFEPITNNVGKTKYISIRFCEVCGKEDLKLD